MSNDYEAACRYATTNQGLDGIVARLGSEGIDVVVEQTGGFCMVATVYADGEHDQYVGVTNDAGTEDEPQYMVCSYDLRADPEDEGKVLGSEVGSQDEVVALVRAWFKGEA